MTRLAVLVLLLGAAVLAHLWVRAQPPPPRATEGFSLAFHGHAAFTLTSARGFHLLMDPYHEKLGLGPLNEVAEVITTSHLHPDHASWHPANQSATILNGVAVDPRTARAWVAPIDGHFYDFEVTSFASSHATTAQADLGPNAIFRVRAGGLTLVHLGDLGRPPAPEVTAAIGPVDVLLVPVGGTFTLDAAGAAAVVRSMDPRLVVPMHAARPGLTVKLDGIEKFLATQGPPRKAKSPVPLKPADLPDRTTVLILE